MFKDFIPAPSANRGKLRKGAQPPRTEMPPAENPEPEIIIAVMGVTGTTISIQASRALANTSVRHGQKLLHQGSLWYLRR